jgi:hypothetical protein
MKLPGETSVQSNIIKPVPLDATESRIAALKVAPGLKIEILIEGLKAPRVIVAAPGGTLYVSSRDEGTISLVPLPGSRPGTIKTVLTKPNVHSLAIRDGRLFLRPFARSSAPIQMDGLLGPKRSLLAISLTRGSTPTAQWHLARTASFT